MLEVICFSAASSSQTREFNKKKIAVALIVYKSTMYIEMH